MGSEHVGPAGRREVLGMRDVHNYHSADATDGTSVFLTSKTAMSVGAVGRYASLGPGEACQSELCRTVRSAASRGAHGGRGRCCGQGGEEALVRR